MDASRDPYRESGTPGSPCPRCQVGLATRDLAGVRIDACTRCEGLFVAPSALLELLARERTIDELRTVLPRARDGLTGGGPLYVKCPRCATLMNRTQYAYGAKVVISYCRRHGTWFECGDLPAVLDFVASGGHERARAREALARREAERDARWRSTMEVARARWEVTRIGRHRHVAAFFADLFS